MRDAALAICTQDLSKTYRDGTRALHGVDLEVRRGDVFCLLGPNGAGKTTLTRILATQLLPSGGSARVLGFDVEHEARALRPRLATVPQQSAPDDQLRIDEHVFYYLVARGLSRSAASDATASITDRMGLGDRRRNLVATLSGGMKRRVLLCMALASPAELLLLDEPTVGLDVLVRRDLWRSLLDSKSDRTVLLTTHSMEEAEALADRVAIVSSGELLACGTVAELRGLAPASRKVVLQKNSLPRVRVEGLGHVQEHAATLAVFPRNESDLRRLMALCIEARAEASVLHTTLEDAFVYLVGREERAVPEPGVLA